MYIVKAIEWAFCVQQKSLVPLWPKRQEQQNMIIHSFKHFMSLFAYWKHDGVCVFSLEGESC